MRDYFMKASPIRFIDFIDGDCVNSRDGQLTAQGLCLPVTVLAPAGHTVTLNGAPMRETEDGRYSAEVLLRGYRNTLLAEDTSDNTLCRIVLYHMPRTMGKYRRSSDDNILFLQDLTEHSEKYPSIFDHPYLAIYKKAHDLYGAKVHLNLFWELCDKGRSYFADRHSYFNLTMMTDKYKEEFRANADWLKLAFHARAEFPDNPYAASDAATVTADCTAVLREIVRFASAENISDSTTTHYGSGNHDVIRALRALGFRSLTGYFTLGKNGNPSVSYYCPKDLVEHIDQRDFWVDTEEDMIYGRIDKVLNLDDPEKVKADVRAAIEHPHRGGFVSVMIHEQYFYADYKRHLPDFEERVLSACRDLYEHGYVGAHITEVTAEPHLREFPAFHE